MDWLEENKMLLYLSSLKLKCAPFEVLIPLLCASILDNIHFIVILCLSLPYHQCEEPPDGYI